MNHLAKLLFTIATVMYCGQVSAEAKETAPDGSLTFELTSIAAGVGGSKGKGVLTWEGYEIPFEMSGLTALEVGIAEKRGHGFVYNLKNLSDFDGTYQAQTGAVTVLSGVGYQRLNKENETSNLFVELSSQERGLNVGFTTGRVKMVLDEAAKTRVLAALNAPKKKSATQSVYFDTNSHEVREADKPKLQELVAALKEGPASEVQITGYTDASGSLESNVKLSRSRAQSVYDELQSLAQQKGIGQVPRPRVELFGEGEGGVNVGDETNQALRRVDVAVVYSIPQEKTYR